MASKKPKKLTLLVTEDKRPQVALRPGMALSVVTVVMADPQTMKPAKLGARLCGGSGTCLALVDIDPEGIAE